MEKPAAQMSGLERWSVFFRYFTDTGKQELLKEILEEEEGIGMASQVVQGFTRSEIAYFNKMSDDKYEMRRNALIEEAKEAAKRRGKREGLAEGRAQGLKQGLAEGLAKGEAKGLSQGLTQGFTQGRMESQLEIARKMKARGHPAAEIAEDTGLPLETVQNL